MYPIVEKKFIAPGVTMATFLAPKIARKRRAGQFVILRLYEKGERIPLTIAMPIRRRDGPVISQRGGNPRVSGGDARIEGISTWWGARHPTHIEAGGMCLHRGGIGIAPIHPCAGHGAAETSDIHPRRPDEGFRHYGDMMRGLDEVHVCTDDGSTQRALSPTCPRARERAGISITPSPSPRADEKAVSSLTKRSVFRPS